MKQLQLATWPGHEHIEYLLNILMQHNLPLAKALPFKHKPRNTMVHVCDHNTQKAGAEECEFKVSLGYINSFRPVCATRQDSFSKKQHQSTSKQQQNIINLKYLQQNLGERWQKVPWCGENGCSEKPNPPVRKTNSMPSSTCSVKKLKLKLL